jgi:hypothetical protein
MDIVPLEDRGNIESDLALEIKKVIESHIGPVDSHICHQQKSLQDLIIDVSSKTDLHKKLSDLEEKIPNNIAKCRISLTLYWALPRNFTFRVRR